jgi:hypothetical protein
MKFERTGTPVKRLYGAHRGIGMALLAAAAAAICIAACGGSSNASTTTKSTPTTSKTSRTAAETALRTCLSKHGVTLPSITNHGGARGFFGRGTRTGTTPGAGAGTGTTPAGGPPTGAPGAGGGFGGGRFAGGSNSKLAKAFKACGGKLGGFGAGGFRGGYGGYGGYGGGYGGAGVGAGHFRPTFSKATLTAFVACVRKNGYPAMPEAKTNPTTGGFFPASVEKNANFRKASVKCVSILRQAAGAANPGGPNQPATTTTSSSS